MRGGIPLRRLLPFLLLLLMLPAARADALPDGHFHGYYADGGSVQIELDFTVENGRFASAAYETLAYRDGDYRRRRPNARLPRSLSSWQAA